MRLKFGKERLRHPDAGRLKKELPKFLLDSIELYGIIAASRNKPSGTAPQSAMSLGAPSFPTYLVPGRCTLDSVGLASTTLFDNVG